jgi:predicted dehydrogenase
MRFAVAGNQPSVLAVARAIALNPAHQIVALVGPQPGAAFLPLAPGVPLCRDWEELLTDCPVDAVLLSGHHGAPEPELNQAVRQLAQAGIAVLLPPELTQPAAEFYELSLIEAESPGRLFPLLGLHGHAQVQSLCEALAQNTIGNLRHVRIDRQLAAAAGLISRNDLDRALLCDADLLRVICGEYDEVTASRSGDDDHGYSQAMVTLDGDAVPQAVWAATAAGGNEDFRLTLSGSNGTAILEGNPEAACLRLTLETGGAPPVTEESTDDGGTWLLEKFVASVGRDHKAELNASNSLWEELARAVELVEAVERSVRRRRTIDVYFETPSERSLFKTQMTAVGCSLILLTLLAVVLYLVLAATVGMPPLLKKILVGLIFLPLGIFLALQLLIFIARPASRDG